MSIIKRTVSLFLLNTVLLSAAGLTPGDIIRQTEPIKLPAPKKVLPSIAPLKYKAPLVVKDSVKIWVKSFRFSGNTVFTSELLSALVREYKERELGLFGLQEAASRITKYYRENGYFVARAYLPQQSLKEGIVEIAIIEGSYGKFNIKNSSLVDTDVVQGYMDYLQTGEIVSTYTLERQMLLLNDLSGAQIASAEIAAGKTVGSSDFKMSVAAEPKYRGYLIADSYGSRYTGENRLNAHGYVNSLTGRGDTLDLSALSTNTGDLKNAGVGYERPFGYDGLKAGASFGITDYRLSDELANLESSGRIDTYTAHLSYPYIKTQNHTLAFDLGYEHKKIKYSMLAEETRKSIDSVTLKATTTQKTMLVQLPGSLYASAGVTAGNLGFDNAKAYTDDLINAHGRFAKANLDIYHNQYLANRVSLKTMFKVQKSLGRNLDSSEDISVSGSNGVRAYEDSELSGDQGYGLSLDLAYVLPAIRELSHSASIFLDHARVWRNTDPSVTTEKNTRTLNAIGIGWNGAYEALEIKVSLAHGFGGERTPTAESQTDTNVNKLLAQGIYRF